MEELKGMLASAAGLLRRTASGFVEDGAEKHSAALAFYALFTVGPLLVIATAAAGGVFGDEAVSHELARRLEMLLSPEAAALVERMVASAAEPGSGLRATVLGLLVLLPGATLGFAQLQASLNAVWNVRPKPQPLLRSVRTMLWKRLLSFGAVLVVGAILATSLVFSALIALFGEIVGRWLTIDPLVLRGLDSGVDFVLMTGFLAIVYKVFPDAEVRWRDVAVGAVVTSVSMGLGQVAFSLYVTHTAVTSGYGPAGALVALVLLAYLSALAFLFGAELTQAWAERYGHGIVPSPHAARVEIVLRDETS